MSTDTEPHAVERWAMQAGSMRYGALLFLYPEGMASFTSPATHATLGPADEMRALLEARGYTHTDTVKPSPPIDTA